nr:olfactory receptor 3 [Tropidothorax elegans]
MWDFRQLRWLNYCGWWPEATSTPLGHRFSKVMGWFLYLVDVAQIGPELIGLFLAVAKGSLKGTVLNLSTTLMGLLCGLKVGTILLRGPLISQLVSKFREMEDEVRLVLPQDVVEDLSRQRESYAKATTYFTIPLLLFILHWIIRPVWLFFQGQKVLVIEAWFPGNIDDISYWAFIWVNQTIHVATAMFGFVVFDSIIYCLLETFLLMIQYLEAALVRLDFEPPGVDAHSQVTLRFCVHLHIQICK